MAESKFAIPPFAIVMGVLVVAGAGGFWYLDRASKQPPPPPPPLTAEARTYVGNLKLSDVDMSAHEDYFRQRVVEITGKIQNAGSRKLNLVEINCVFYDPYGQVVLRQRTPIVSGKAGGLAPGDTKPFRLPFDTIPESWNNVMPQMVIARIDFE
ncbi:MAG TPA: FxLYD domain-containing protein [Bryobacteraceae bacterium]